MPGRAAPAGALAVLLRGAARCWCRGSRGAAATTRWWPVARGCRWRSSWARRCTLPDGGGRASRCSADVTTAQTRRLVESAVDTYDKSKSFYARAGRRRRRARPARPRRRRDGRGAGRPTGTTTSAWTRSRARSRTRPVRPRSSTPATTPRPANSWEAFSLDSVTAAFEDLDRWGVAGNHDHGVVREHATSPTTAGGCSTGPCVQRARPHHADRRRRPAVQRPGQTGATRPASASTRSAAGSPTRPAPPTSEGHHAAGPRRRPRRARRSTRGLRGPGARRPPARPGRPDPGGRRATARSATPTPTARPAARRTPSRSAASCAARPR